MKNPIKFTLLSVLLLSIISCNSSKFNFSSAYKFSTYKSSTVKKQPVLVKSHQTGPIASLKRQPLLSANLPVVQMKESFKSYEDLTRVERKALKKELKKELKRVRKEYKSTYKDVTASGGMNKWIYTGVVIGAAGLILLIIDVATVLGAIALVVGLGFIVYGFLVKGGAV